MLSSLLYATLLCTATASPLVHRNNDGSAPSASIKNGTVNGILYKTAEISQDLFLGIPYAQPPVGNQRLRGPQPLNASFGTLAADAYGPHCWSRFTTGYVRIQLSIEYRRCLTLVVGR